MTFRVKAVALATLAMSSMSVVSPAGAGTLFSRAEIDQSKLVAVASPYSGGNAHQLLVIEQIASSRPCWSESSNGSGLTIINPLLGGFDFTGICGRSLDSNGYSIRMADEDLGWKYSLRVLKRNGDLMLVGVPTTDRKLPELQIGRANGLTNGFAKLSLNPGWRMTKRVYNGQTVGHVYLTNDRPLTTAIATAPTQPTIPAPLPLPKPSVTPSVPISVPTPGTVGSVRPVPTPKPSTSIPIFVPRPATSGGVTQPPSSTTTPVVGRPITVPLPPTVSRPVTGTSGAVTSPVVRPVTGSRPVTGTSGAVTSPGVTSPVVKPTPAPSTPKPIFNAGDFVVPTIDNP